MSWYNCLHKQLVYMKYKYGMVINWLWIYCFPCDSQPVHSINIFSIGSAVVYRSWNCTEVNELCLGYYMRLEWVIADPSQSVMLRRFTYFLSSIEQWPAHEQVFCQWSSLQQETTPSFISVRGLSSAMTSSRIAVISSLENTRPLLLIL